MSLLAFYFSHSAADIISNFRVDCLFNLTQTFLKMLGGGGGEWGGGGWGGRGGNVERNADFQCTKSLNSEDYLINSYPPLISILFRSSPCASRFWNPNWSLSPRKAVKRKRLGFFQYPYMVDGLLTGSSNLTQLTKVKLTDKKLTAGVVA